MAPPDPNPTAFWQGSRRIPVTHFLGSDEWRRLEAGGEAAEELIESIATALRPSVQVGETAYVAAETEQASGVLSLFRTLSDSVHRSGFRPDEGIWKQAVGQAGRFIAVFPWVRVSCLLVVGMAAFWGASRLTDRFPPLNEFRG